MTNEKQAEYIVNKFMQRGAVVCKEDYTWVLGVLNKVKQEILDKLEKEDDWLEMHKVENSFDSGKIMGIQQAINIIKDI